MCVDSKQNIYVTDDSVGGAEAVFEYAHGGTVPIRIFGVGGYPEDCAIDPTTGDLAVTVFVFNGEFVAIFRKARGKPSVYTDTGFGFMNACTYDSNGNLFVDGNVVSGKLQFIELPKAAVNSRVLHSTNRSWGPREFSGMGKTWPLPIQVKTSSINSK